ncbi:MAG: hypothetical protein HYZ53_18765 [Planctomycetes bacterium]|nr:hypothetical protein [Planctomycetota bacterium]
MLRNGHSLPARPALPRLLARAVLGCALLFAGATPVLAQDPPGAPEDDSATWSGIDGFVILLQRSGVHLLGPEEVAEPNLGPGTLIILLGTPPPQPTLLRILGFQHHWTGLLVASDRKEMAGVFDRYGLELDTSPYQMRDPTRGAFHGYADCPLIRGHGNSPLIEGVKQIALNRPARFVGRHRTTLSRLPEEPGRERCAWIVAKENPKSLFISDHSLFINLMLNEESNAVFATNVIRWFGATDVWLIVDGETVHSELFPPGMPDFGPQASIRLLDHVIRATEEAHGLRNLDPRYNAFIATGATILLAVVLSLWLVRRPAAPAEILGSAPALLSEFGDPGSAPAGERNFRIPAQEFLEGWWRRFRSSRGLPEDAGRVPGAFDLAGGSTLARWRLGNDLGALAAAIRMRDGRLSLRGFESLRESARRCESAGSELRIAWRATAPRA